MSGVIIYQSTYGSTREYAEWIRDETRFQLFESRDKSIPLDANTIVIGSPVIAFRPVLLAWISRHWDKLQGKRVFLFTTSAADPAKQPVREMIEKSLPEKVRSGIRVFPLAGRFDFEKLTAMHKFMMRIAAVISRDIRRQMRNRVDGVARENLRDLLAAIKG